MKTVDRNLFVFAPFFILNSATSPENILIHKHKHPDITEKDRQKKSTLENYFSPISDIFKYDKNK